LRRAAPPRTPQKYHGVAGVGTGDLLCAKRFTKVPQPSISGVFIFTRHDHISIVDPCQRLHFQQPVQVAICDKKNATYDPLPFLNIEAREPLVHETALLKIYEIPLYS